ncbi:hypothetical protein PoB_001974200 [Plakobranchus ocellatus]|uniref:Uncharacterized protein n=1 Tax=Plakobranchus ocellatus TaxID=259542 RepID=A0AAV3ZFH2_9GAST|nr:hypothetical protein PoB_001974200 [Plakobranchus ocellatus]
MAIRRRQRIVTESLSQTPLCRVINSYCTVDSATLFWPPIESPVFQHTSQLISTRGKIRVKCQTAAGSWAGAGSWKLADGGSWSASHGASVATGGPPEDVSTSLGFWRRHYFTRVLWRRDWRSASPQPQLPASSGSLASALAVAPRILQVEGIAAMIGLRTEVIMHMMELRCKLCICDLVAIVVA